MLKRLIHERGRPMFSGLRRACAPGAHDASGEGDRGSAGKARSRARSVAMALRRRALKRLDLHMGPVADAQDERVDPHEPCEFHQLGPADLEQEGGAADPRCLGEKERAHPQQRMAGADEPQPRELEGEEDQGGDDEDEQHEPWRQPGHARRDRRLEALPREPRDQARGNAGAHVPDPRLEQEQRGEKKPEGAQQAFHGHFLTRDCAGKAENRPLARCRRRKYRPSRGRGPVKSDQTW